MPVLLGWLASSRPDIVCLQELKCSERDFPRSELEDAGYNVVFVGQKSYNGVAIMAKSSIELEEVALPDDPEIMEPHSVMQEARYIQAFIGGKIRIASIYLPNGNPIDGHKFQAKLLWLQALIRHAKKLLLLEEPLILAGDYNVCPTDADVYDPYLFINDALCQPQSRAGYRKLLYSGFTDALAAIIQPPPYTYWDYQGFALNKNHGLRIDHLLLSPQAADFLQNAGIDKEVRGQERPSDHVPVWCELSL